MKREDYKIHIIGAGISGLIAAKTLEEKGYKPVIIEGTDRVGGRIKTDVIEGYQLDPMLYLEKTQEAPRKFKVTIPEEDTAQAAEG